MENIFCNHPILWGTILLAAVILHSVDATGKSITNGVPSSVPAIIGKMYCLEAPATARKGTQAELEATDLARASWDSHYWIEKVLAGKWRPRSNSTMCLMKEQIDGRDVTRMNWSVNGCEFEATQTGSLFVLKVVETNTSLSKQSAPERVEHVRKLCRRIFSQTSFRYDGNGNCVVISELTSNIAAWSAPSDVSPAIEGNAVNHSPSKIPETERDRILPSGKTNWINSRSAFSYWFRHIYWWNVGDEVVFYLPKIMAGGSNPFLGPLDNPDFEDRRDWNYFDLTKRGRIYGISTNSDVRP